MKKTCLALLLCGVFLLPAAASAEWGIGGGIFYNRQLGDLRNDRDFDKDFISYMVSLKYQALPFLGVEGSVDYYNGNETIDYTIRPMGTAILTIPLPVLDLFNAGLGINSTYTKYNSSSEWSKLSYHFKAGIQIPVAGLLWILGDCYYFVDDLRDIEDFDSDLLVFGARVMLRF